MPRQVNEKMQALDDDGNVIEGLWCIGDLNGKMMLAHAASAPTSPRKPFVKKIAAESPALFRGLFKASANDDAGAPSDDMLLAMSGAMA